MAMSAIQELSEFVQKGTAQYRKGAEIEHKDGATHIYAMPSADTAETRTINVGFMRVGVIEPVASKEELVRLMRAALNSDGVYQNIDADRFAKGPSYIEVGAWIGDQGMALCLFAMLEWFGLAKTMTPESLGMPGNGFVMSVPNAEFHSLMEETVTT